MANNTGRFRKFIGQVSRGESHGPQLAVGTLLVVTILYAATIM
ncbi:MAG: hypothetical protein ACOYNL_04775 [Rickettsiales bacterium]